MIKKKRNASLVVFSFSILAMSMIGYGSWIIYSPTAFKSDFKIAKTTEKKVCYIGNTYYTTIERALKDAADSTANETIYVIPGSNPTITKSCTIASGDTLCLPFEGTTYNGRQQNASSTGTWKEDIGSAKFADNDQTSVSKYLTTNLTIRGNVTLTNNGNLQIGGVLGVENISLNGQTSGKYCQITMNTGAHIVNYGTIDCMGYIKESQKNNNSTITNNNGSKMYLPFVVYDYKGGSFTASIYANDTNKEFPVSQFDFPNNQIETTFNYGSSLVGYADLYTSEVVKKVSKKLIVTLTATITLAARHNTDDLEIIGNSNSLFEFDSSSSSIVMKYTPIGDNKYTTYSVENGFRIGSGGLTNINIYNGAIFNATSLSINAADDISVDPKAYTWAVELVVGSLNQTVKTSDIYFPISWNYTLDIKSGVFNINNKMKFLGGSKIVIDKGAEICNNSLAILYDSSSGSPLFKDTAFSSTVHPYSKGDATLMNNGTIRLKKGSSFGGKIQTDSIDSSIVVESGANLSNSSREGKGAWTISGLSVAFSFEEYANSPINKNACVDVLNSEGKLVETKLSNSTSYKSIDSNGIFSWMVA